jgi:hypothetical protein
MISFSVQCAVIARQDQAKRGVLQGPSIHESEFESIHITSFLKEASQFFKKRAVVEEEYGKSLQKLVQTTANLYSLGEGKAG